jgi:DNA mismatch endonuclease (patch repair protein)
MPDHMTPEQRSRAMKRVKLRNGSLERIVQQELKVRSLKFRRHVRSLPGSPDIVFYRSKVAIFIDGDFWHGWRLPAWEHNLSPFWRDKLRTNRARDRRNFRKLRSRGWKVIRLWQHQIASNLEGSIARITGTVPPKQANKIEDWRPGLAIQHHASRCNALAPFAARGVPPIVPRHCPLGNVRPGRR